MAFRKTEKKSERRSDKRQEKFESPLPKKRRWLPIFEGDVKDLDFKDMRTLSRFVTERGKILPRRITGLTAQQQRMITTAIKRARQISVMPFISYGS